MVRFLLALSIVALSAGTAAAQLAPGVLPRGIFTATVTGEIDMSKDRAGDPTSIAPDLSIGVTDELTLSLISSTFGRTGFRGGAGGGICLTDACLETADNAGVEAAYNLVAGPFSLAANVGVHANSFDLGHYAAKLGLRMRVRAGPINFISVPSVAIAITKRDDEMAKNRDRVFVPLNVTIPIHPLTLGLITGIKGPLDDFDKSYEIAAGAFVAVAVNDSVSLSASWVHGKLFGGEAVIPDGTSGVDFRALQVWLTITRSAYPRYK